MENNLVSIIIPLYNKEKYIDETINNIKKQTYKNWELIIIDDCSEDNSYDIAKKHQCENIYILKNQYNEGPAISRNKGLEKAVGRYICYQDADDLWDEYKLEKQLKFMKENNCAFSYTGFRYINKKGRIKRRINIQSELTYNEALKDIRILTISTMFDLKKIEKCLLKMPNINSEEIATWWNILRNGYTAYGINEALVYYRKTKKSLTSNKLKSANNRWNIYRKYEKFSIPKSLYYFIHYVYYAIIKRL